MQAAVANAEADVQAQTKKLEAALEELNSLRYQCDELRRQHSEALQHQSSVEKRLAHATVERQTLLASIEDVRRTINQLNSDKDAVQLELRNQAADISSTEAKKVYYISHKFLL